MRLKDGDVAIIQFEQLSQGLHLIKQKPAIETICWSLWTKDSRILLSTDVSRGHCVAHNQFQKAKGDIGHFGIIKGFLTSVLGKVYYAPETGVEIDFEDRYEEFAKTLHRGLSGISVPGGLFFCGSAPLSLMALLLEDPLRKLIITGVIIW